MLRHLIVAAGVVVLDQLTKAVAAAYLIRGGIEIAPFFRLTLVHNSGSAFGFLNDAGGWQNMFFVGIAVLACGVIVFMIRRLSARDLWLGVALSLVLGGAVGNLIDRLLYGYVIDFIDIYYRSWHWPAFNVADSAISIGAVILVLDAIGLGTKSAKTGV